MNIEYVDLMLVNIVGFNMTTEYIIDGIAHEVMADRKAIQGMLVYFYIHQHISKRDFDYCYARFSRFTHPAEILYIKKRVILDECPLVDTIVCSYYLFTK